MIATSVAYDLVFVIHLAAALVTIAVFVALHVAGSTLARGADHATLAKRFPPRRNWAARAIHLVALSGIYMAATGGKDVSFSRPWVGVGLLCYLLVAGHLEARTLPFERRIASLVAAGETPREMGKRFVASVDVALALIAVALIAMVTQF
ncbi:MAG: hypothetical protein KGR42_03625 [Acidobacteria bacterium]|nr:hypothetical protein [Acidobacteriota bacterium]